MPKLVAMSHWRIFRKSLTIPPPRIVIDDFGVLSVWRANVRDANGESSGINLERVDLVVVAFRGLTQGQVQ